MEELLPSGHGTHVATKFCLQSGYIKICATKPRQELEIYTNQETCPQSFAEIRIFY